MEQEVLKILSSGKCLDRYKRVLHLLNGEDSDKYKKKTAPKESIPWLELYLQKTNLCLL